MTTWLGSFIGIWQESGMTMSRKECVKITTTKFCGTSVFESTMKLCLRTDLVITDERERERGADSCAYLLRSMGIC